MALLEILRKTHEFVVKLSGISPTVMWLCLWTFVFVDVESLRCVAMVRVFLLSSWIRTTEDAELEEHKASHEGLSGSRWRVSLTGRRWSVK